MKIYIDLYFIFNLIMDIIIVMSTSILLKRKTSNFRIIISGLIGAIFSLFLFSGINKILIEILSVLLMSIISFNFKNIRYTFRNILYLYFISTILGGIIYLFNIKVSTNIFFTYFIIIIISIEVMVLYIKEIKKMKDFYNNYYSVIICFKDDSKISLIGFVDTGNNLYDPYKKRPIILVANKYYKDDNFILVPYSTISDDGLLKCIKPKFIIIDGVEYKKDVLVVFSDKPLLIDGVDVILHKDILKG